MFDELEKYKNKNHFFLNAGDNLETVCNAPDLPGVFLVFMLARGKNELVYIGFSRKELKQSSGKRYALEFGTLKEEIVDGVALNKSPNKVSWMKKLAGKGVDALDIYWYVTMDKKVIDFPEDVERAIMQSYIHIYGKLPTWNAL
jgi:hypothetical protein